MDSDILVDFGKTISIQPTGIVLDYKNCDYLLELQYPNQPVKKIMKPRQGVGAAKVVPIKAVFGIIEAEVNKYLAVVTKSVFIGQIYGRKVIRVENIDLYCLAGKDDARDRPYILMLKKAFNQKDLYFSHQYDLTSSLEQWMTNNMQMRNYRSAYMFNAEWVHDFLQVKAYQWVNAFISGYFRTSFIQNSGSQSLDLTLLTRRDHRRQGRRWITRGCDLDGCTANTAETEMILAVKMSQKTIYFSHVQLRGSMPFIWSQMPDLKWSPSVKIHPNDKLNTELMKKNYQDVLKSTTNCTIINLIDKKGSQDRLGKYFELTHSRLAEPNMRLVWFDFHAECKNMKYQNLVRLLDQLNEQMSTYGYFHIQIESNVRSSKKNSQKGVFRTNCMDCLDRTNVVQSVIARQILLEWLSELKIMNKSGFVSAFQKLPNNIETVFRLQWTQNANVVSELYSGTPAMKTDFTATGRRTFKGALNDGYSGAKRFFLGNFYDSRWQFLLVLYLGFTCTSSLMPEWGSLSCSGGAILFALLFAKILQLSKSVWIRKPTKQLNVF